MPNHLPSSTLAGQGCSDFLKRERPIYKERSVPLCPSSPQLHRPTLRARMCVSVRVFWQEVAEVT